LHKDETGGRVGRDTGKRLDLADRTGESNTFWKDGERQIVGSLGEELCTENSSVSRSRVDIRKVLIAQLWKDPTIGVIGSGIGKRYSDLVRIGSERLLPLWSEIGLGVEDCPPLTVVGA
jgi:hypothetical protein